MLSGKEVRIVSLLLIDTVFFLVELISGYAVHSLALVADSFHMLNDIISLLIALWAVGMAKNKSPDAKYTYGWKRAEILGALVNSVFLIALCVSILIEAIQRFFEPQTITNPKLVLLVGCLGLCSNFVGLLLFHDDGGHGHGHSHGGLDLEGGHGSNGHSHNHSHQSSVEFEDEDEDEDEDERVPQSIQDMLPSTVVESALNRAGKYGLDDETTGLLQGDEGRAHSGKNVKKERKKRSMNMHGVFLHVLGDALGNVGVILTALFIWKTEYSWRFYFDPAVSLIISMIIFSSAIPLSLNASKILLQATPPNVSAEDVKKDILKLPTVVSLHDFHIWNLTESLSIASLHVKIQTNPKEYMNLAKKIRGIFHAHGIHSATVQPEFVGPDEISDDISRRFSSIAGGGVYGSTTSLTNCLIDTRANCNSEVCL